MVMLAVLASVVLACTGGGSSPPTTVVSSAPTSGSSYVGGQVLMKVRDSSRADEAAQAIGGRIVRASSIAGWYLVALDEGVTVEQAIARTPGNPLIEAVEPNYTAEAQPGVESGPTPFAP